MSCYYSKIWGNTTRPCLESLLIYHVPRLLGHVCWPCGDVSAMFLGGREKGGSHSSRRGIYWKDCAWQTWPQPFSAPWDGTLPASMESQDLWQPSAQFWTTDELLLLVQSVFVTTFDDFFSVPILVFQGCHNKIPQTGCLYHQTFLKTASPKSGCVQGCSHSELSSWLTGGCPLCVLKWSFLCGRTSLMCLCMHIVFS